MQFDVCVCGGVWEVGREEHSDVDCEGSSLYKQPKLFQRADLECNQLR